MANILFTVFKRPCLISSCALRSLFISLNRSVEMMKDDVEGGVVYSTIKSKLEENLKPTHLQIFNESYMHNVPNGSETHFKVVIVSNTFEGLPLIKCHRLVMETLKDQLEGPVHALSIQAKTPLQWEESKRITESPPCLGGSKR